MPAAAWGPAPLRFSALLPAQEPSGPDPVTPGVRPSTSREAEQLRAAAQPHATDQQPNSYALDGGPPRGFQVRAAAQPPPVARSPAISPHADQNKRCFFILYFVIPPTPPSIRADLSESVAGRGWGLTNQSAAGGRGMGVGSSPYKALGLGLGMGLVGSCLGSSVGQRRRRAPLRSRARAPVQPNQRGDG